MVTIKLSNIDYEKMIHNKAVYEIIKNTTSTCNDDRSNSIREMADGYINLVNTISEGREEENDK